MVIDQAHHQRYVLPKTGDVRIGRGSDVDIVLNDDSVSRHHAIVRTSNASIVTIEDLGSANGTKVQGGLLRKNTHTPLHRYDLIEIGAVQIILQYVDSPARTCLFCSTSEFENRVRNACARATQERSNLSLVAISGIPLSACASLQLQLANTLDDEDVVTEMVGGRAELLVVSRSPRDIEEQLQRICHDIGCTPTIIVKIHGRDGLVASELISSLRGNLFAETRTLDHAELASPIMHNLYALAEKIAKGNISIVIVGEEGTGKTSLARFIHGHSQQTQNFHIIDCAQPCPETLQKRLWDKKSGLLEQGPNCTLLLRNIDCLTPDLQEQIMTVLNSAADLPRLISTVRRPIEDSVQSALFRTDLYYRLCGVSLDIPPLRQRNADLLSLSRYFLSFTESANIAIPADVEQLLSSYSWPGNIRELQNSIELAALLAEGSTLGVEHFPADKMRTTLAIAEVVPPVVIKAAKPGMRAPGMTKEQIILALEQCGGNQTRAAKHLQVSRRTLTKWIGRFGLPRPRK